MPCPLCKTNAATNAPTDSRTLNITCPACGHYFLTWEARAAIEGDEKLAFDLGAWASEQAANGLIPSIRSETVEWIRFYPRPSVQKRAELYLGAAIRTLNGRLIGRIDIGDQKLRVASWSYHTEDCIAIAEYLEKLGALEDAGNGQQKRIIAKGHLIYEEMIGQRARSSQVFVAMWFSDAVRKAYEEGIAPPIREAGYEPLRVDQTEHDGKIDDRIIAEIRRSAFLVADFTGHRGGVYYEAGFAHGLGRRVLFTCKCDHIDNLHFDVRQYNTILWNTPQEITVTLQHRILALFGAGPFKADARPLLSAIASDSLGWWAEAVGWASAHRRKPRPKGRVRSTCAGGLKPTLHDYMTFWPTSDRTKTRSPVRPWPAWQTKPARRG